MSLRNSTELLEDSVSFYKTHAKTYITIMLVPVLVSILFGLVLEKYLPADEEITREALAALGPTLWLLVGGAIISIIVSMAAYATTILFTAHPSQYPTVMSAYQDAKRYLVPYLWVSILMLLTFIAGTLFLLIPGVIIGIWFVVSDMTVLFDEKRGIGALKASKALVTGRWWQVFLRILVLGAVYLIFSYGFEYVLGNAVSDASIVSSVIGAWEAFVLTPIAAIYLYFLYTNLKATGPVGALSADTTP